jgi:hypothetical protein
METKMDTKIAEALEQLWKQAQEQHAAELARAEWERS